MYYISDKFLLDETFFYKSITLNSGRLRVVICPLLKGPRHWKVVKQRLSHLGQGMSVIWDVRYWQISLYKVKLLTKNRRNLHQIRV